MHHKEINFLLISKFYLSFLIFLQLAAVFSVEGKNFIFVPIGILLTSFNFDFFWYFLAQLHKNLYYYETLHVDDFTHKVVKRGIKYSSNPFNTIKEVEFKALGRNFRLILHPHKEVLHHNFKAYLVNSTGEEQIIHFDHSNLYRGRVFGELESHVHAQIEDGIITAVS